MMSGSIRPMLAGATFAVAAIVLSGCGLDPQGGYRPAERSGSPEAKSFNEVHAQCWTTSMNIAGFAATVPEQEAYKACMARNGWEDRRSLF